MNATPTQPGRDDREELARLLPPPAERDLPSGRHREVQEFVMAQIREDLQSAGPAPRRTRGRRPLVIGAALTAVAGATAVAVVVGTTGGSGGSVNAGGSQAHSSPGHSAGSLSGRQVLLAAASTAERAPAGSGTYWHVKIEYYTKTSSGATGTSVIETWTRRDGRSWARSGSPNSPVKENGGKYGYWNDGFTVGSTHLSYRQIQRLPADPAALKKWITHHSELMKDVGQHHGTTVSVDDVIVGGLSGLLEMTPAPPAVRAAAFRALASLPEVRNLGRVDGGQGLQITNSDGTLRMVLDPATSRIRSSSFTGKGAKTKSGTDKVDAAEWTNAAPR
ncbi:CU044_5270 family protein [Actinoallomurus sp. NPDC052308]|uniref:CU044_5270 family protein n=1 Tax=Actinoallomurus sp. NPDC052308 TaxID=3155530 RepID=UPI0034473B23